MIVTGGENVYCGGRRRDLRIPGVAEASIVGVPDPHWGENVIAVVLTGAGHDGHRGRDHRRLPGRLAGYKKPKQVFFVDELPRNASGKILKRELRDRLRRRRPNRSQPVSKRSTR